MEYVHRSCAPKPQPRSAVTAGHACRTCRQRSSRACRLVSNLGPVRRRSGATMVPLYDCQTARPCVDQVEAACKWATYCAHQCMTDADVKVAGASAGCLFRVSKCSYLRHHHAVRHCQLLHDLEFYGSHPFVVQHVCFDQGCKVIRDSTAYFQLHALMLPVARVLGVLSCPCSVLLQMRI